MRARCIPAPTASFRCNRFASDPGFDKYQTETGAISSLFEHSFNNAVKIRQNIRYAHVEGIYRTAYPNDLCPYTPPNPNFPFLDPSRRTVERYIWSRETAKDSFTSDSNVELKFGPGRCSTRRWSASTTAASRSARDPATATTPRHSTSTRRSITARPRRLSSPNRSCGRASSGFMRRTRCGSGRGWPSSASARISSATMCRDRRRKTPGRPPAVPG